MSYINESDARLQLESIGLLLPAVQLELAVGGKSRRCKVSGMDSEKRGWYRLSEWVADEGVFLVGTYGIFEGDDPGVRKIELSKRCADCGHEMPLKAKECPACKSKQFKSRELTPEQKAAHKARYEADKKAEVARRNGEIKKAAQWASAVWRASVECTPDQHDYFARKHLDRTGGARIYPGNDGVMLEGATPDDYKYLGTFVGAMVLPMCDVDGNVYGVQFILSRQIHKERIARTGRDKDFWPAGMSAEGKMFVVGGTPHDVALIAEGYATGISLHMATGMPVVIAYNAGGLLPVAQALRKRYKRCKFMIGADDDWLQKCKACGTYTPVASATCAHCGEPHGKMNAGLARASEAALAVDGVAFVHPVFSDERPADKKGPTDFNDLHVIESLNTVRMQIEAAIERAEFKPAAPALVARGESNGGAGDGDNNSAETITRRGAVSTMRLDDLVDRFIYVDDDTGDFAFDTWTKQVVKLSKVIKLLPARIRFDDVKDHPLWKSRAVYIDQIGFDPAGEDKNVLCNRWTGWSTKPKAGECERQLELLRYLCSNEPTGAEIFHHILCWMAYPLQNLGAKLKSAIVIHGPQGTGKSMVFESYARIFGDYAMILNQGAIEDKFNADWSERKLFILADEIVARAEMHHLKNQLKNFITGDWVRVNPKNVAAHRERNHMNILFNSNEDQPVVLENDDRRHLVIWTPPKLPADFYVEVAEEIETGGVAALHHYLLNYDVGSFRPWTLPPMTQAKRDLIAIGADSIERFMGEWQGGDIDGIPFCPCGTGDLYRLYLRWCRENGEKFPRTSAQFVGRIAKREGWVKAHKDRFVSLVETGTVRQRMIIPPESALVDGLAHGKDFRRKDHETITQWISNCYFDFRNAVDTGANA